LKYVRNAREALSNRVKLAGEIAGEVHDFLEAGDVTTKDAA
jgi:hypothetical protein